MKGELEKKARIASEEEQEDRISTLPDELIHKILKFVDTKSAVQTSVLSKRWKLVWTTLPFLKFKWDQQGSPTNITNLTRHVLNHRNHRSPVLNLKLAFLPTGLTAKFIEYAIFRNVQYLNVQFRPDHKPYKLSNFSSNSIQKLSVRVNIDDYLSKLDCWDLPALTTPHLKYPFFYRNHNVPELALTRLPALRTLCLKNWDLKPFSFRLPALTTLILSKCQLPNKVWNFPALKSPTLHEQVFQFPENMSDIFAALVSLQNLTISAFCCTIGLGANMSLI